MAETNHVDPQDPALRNSQKSEVKEDEETLSATLGHEPCYWNDKKYSDGASVCDSKILYKCWSGRWVEVGQC